MSLRAGFVVKMVGSEVKSQHQKASKYPACQLNVHPSPITRAAERALADANLRVRDLSALEADNRRLREEVRL